MTVLVFASEKGGVGKTSAAVNVAAGLTRHGRVLVVDADPQGALTSALGVVPAAGAPTLGDLLAADPAPLVDAVVLGVCPGLDLIPAVRGSLSRAATTMILEPAGERYMADALAGLDDPDGPYDWVVVDTPPNLDRLTLAAVIAADWVVGVYESKVEAVNGISATIGFVEYNRRRGLSRAQMLGLVNNMSDPRLLLSRQAESMVADLPVPVLATRIPERTRLAEAAAFQRPVREIFPDSELAAVLDDLADEIVAAVITASAAREAV